MPLLTELECLVCAGSYKYLAPNGARMSRISDTFQGLRREGRKGFIPFITAGDPNLSNTRDIIVELANRGATIIELGVPFSDPMADGPVIQRASERALRHGFGLAEIFAMLNQPERALEGLSLALEEGYRCYRALVRHREWDILRDHPQFGMLVEHAAETSRYAETVFLDNGGERLLGISRSTFSAPAE